MVQLAQLVVRQTRYARRLFAHLELSRKQRLSAAEAAAAEIAAELVVAVADAAAAAVLT